MTAEPYFENADKWADELLELRRIALDCDLEETLKWRQPCYTAGGRNIVILGVRKDHCVLSFIKGALLPDPNGLLEDVGPNTRSAKVLRLQTVEHILAQETAIRDLIAEAVAAERAGLRVERPAGEPTWTAELQERLDNDPDFRTAWEALTPGRRRGFHLHFSQPKQSSTREARIDRSLPRILAGKGIHDCVCGRSKRPPRCDGTHRHP
jgi:uncharacterized protein YdeI (YjbR/CyaY-like superfamily)